MKRNTLISITVTTIYHHQPKREMKLLLQDIIENTEMIFQFVGTASYEEFIDDKMKVYAVVRAFEIPGKHLKLFRRIFW